jgi:hypothetical protein
MNWLKEAVFVPIGYQGAAQHTYTPNCDGFHESGQCKTNETIYTVVEAK